MLVEDSVIIAEVNVSYLDLRAFSRLQAASFGPVLYRHPINLSGAYMPRGMVSRFTVT